MFKTSILAIFACRNISKSNYFSPGFFKWDCEKSLFQKKKSEKVIFVLIFKAINWLMSAFFFKNFFFFQVLLYALLYHFLRIAQKEKKAAKNVLQKLLKASRICKLNCCFMTFYPHLNLRHMCTVKRFIQWLGMIYIGPIIWFRRKIKQRVWPNKDLIKIYRQGCNKRMYWTNFWQPTVHAQKKYFWKNSNRSLYFTSLRFFWHLLLQNW